MNKLEFEEWKNSPITKEVLKYLEDLTQRDCRFIVQDFVSGVLHTMDKESMALNEGKNIARLELGEIDYEEIEEFYEKEREPDQDPES